MKKIIITTSLIVLTIAALALAQGNQGKTNGQHQGQANGQYGQQYQGQGNGQHQGQGNGQHQGQGNGNGQGNGSSCSMNSETSTALYEALVGSDGEYAAYAMYGAVIDKYGAVEPYVSIQRAEGKHIDALKRQMDKYGISYPPVNPYLGNVDAPESLEQAAAAWAEGEIANVAMYDDLLLASKDCDSVSRVFTNLRRASESMHLPAFELAAQSGGTLSPAQMETLKAEHHNGSQSEDCQAEGQGNGEHQGNNGQYKGQGNGNGQHQGQGNGNGQGNGSSCSMNSETSTALYEALVGSDGEYAAYAMYGAVIDKYGAVEPYVSIQRAEGKHIDALKRQMDKYGISYPPVNPYLGNVDAPESLEQAAAAWAEGEIANVAMYDDLLLASKDCDSVSRVFTNLRRASESMHLPAFELAAQSGGTLSPAQMETLKAEHHNGSQSEDCQAEGQGNGEHQGNNGQYKGQGNGNGQGNSGVGQKQVEEIMSKFQELDLDANGEISKQEFFDTKTANMTQKAQEGKDLKNAANAPAFEDIDANGDESISMEEFGMFAMSHHAEENAANEADMQAQNVAATNGLEMPLPTKLATNADSTAVRAALLDTHETLCEDVGNAAQILMKTETLAKALPFIMDMTGMQPGEIEALEQSTCKTDLSNASIPEIRQSNQIASWLVDLHLVGINQALSDEPMEVEALPLPVPLAANPEKDVIRSTILDIHDSLCGDVGNAADILMKTETLAKALPFIMDMTGMQPGEIEALEQSTCKTDLSNASITEIRESNRIAVWLVDLHLVGINKALSAE